MSSPFFSDSEVLALTVTAAHRNWMAAFRSTKRGNRLFHSWLKVQGDPSVFPAWIIVYRDGEAGPWKVGMELPTVVQPGNTDYQAGGGRDIEWYGQEFATEIAAMLWIYEILVAEGIEYAPLGGHNRLREKLANRPAVRPLVVAARATGRVSEPGRNIDLE